MKHLLIFEAFTSQTLSAVTKHLKKKISKEAYTQFIEKLKSYQSLFDIPLSSISEDSLVYMSSKKAIPLAPDDLIHNSFGIWAIKFWFDLEKGFIMETGIGNKVIPLDGRNKTFTSDELEFIKTKLIKTGKIKLVNDYNKLRNRDKVIGYFNYDESPERLALATIWRRDDYIYAIQNVAEGTNPQDDWSEEDWKDWGRYGWNLCVGLDNINNDHKKLHHYIPSSDELSYEYDKEYWSNNLPINSSGFLTNWSRVISKLEEVKDSDYCVVLFLDQLLVDHESLEDIKKSRREARKGATKLLSDDEIRKINLDRYLQNLGKFKDEEGNLINLQKFINYAIIGKFGFYSLYNFTGVNKVASFISILEYSINANTYDDKKLYKTKLDNLFRSVYETYSNYIKNYSDGLKVVKTIKNDKVQYIISVIEQINGIIFNYFSQLNINNLDDLEFIYNKLATINNLICSARFKLYSFRNVISNLNNPGMIQRNYIRKSYWQDDILDIDIKKIDNLKRYVDSLCK
jgi:hypothetical protein